MLIQMEQMDIAPTVVTYNVLIHGHCRAGALDKALDLLQTMEKTSTVPDAYTYNILINDHCKNGDLQRANGFFERHARKKPRAQ